MATPELRRSHLSSAAYLRTSLFARLAVLSMTTGTADTLLLLGCSPHAAVATTLAAACGGAEISARLAEPLPAPWLRVAALSVILALVVILIGAGQQPLTSVLAVLAIAGASVEVARRVADPPAPASGPSA
jgi:hypothetical protein